MTKLRLLAASTATLVATSISARANQADDILGVYRNPDGSRTVEVYRDSDQYFGVIATAPAEPDGNEGVGFVVFRNFVFDPMQKAWVSGELDSPMFPKITFSGTLSLNENNDLVVRGYVGLPILGGSSVFPRLATNHSRPADATTE